ncbi:MAG: hypothetical protein D6694_07355 [Gammaproteobacteria bacterium]|nr:MAG: hypothetical protein D6694_07355 [Gammaproteobacteria bacterium]
MTRYDGEQFYNRLAKNKQDELTSAFVKYLKENEEFSPYTLYEDGLFPDTQKFETLPLSELLDAVEVVEQAELQESSVISILKGDKGLLKGNPLYTFLEVSNTVDGIVIISGRHRVTALSLLGFLAEQWCTAHDAEFDYEAFIDQPIPVIFRRYDVNIVTATNGSRTMRPFEKSSVAGQALGIDTSNVTELLESMASGKFPKGFALAVGLELDNAELSPNTTLAIVNSALSKLKMGSKLGAKLTKRFETLEVLLAAFPDALQTALQKGGYVDATGELSGNVARGASSIGELVAKALLTNPEVKAYIDELVKAEQVAAKARGKAKATKTTSRKRPAAKTETIDTLSDEAPADDEF